MENKKESYHFRKIVKRPISHRFWYTSCRNKTAQIWDVESGKKLQELSGHTDIINSAVFSPDGRRIVTGSVDNTARIWDVDTGKELQTLEGHTRRVETEDSGIGAENSGIGAAVFSPDGKKVVTGGEDGTARIWTLE